MRSQGKAKPFLFYPKAKAPVFLMAFYPRKLDAGFLALSVLLRTKTGES
tara:strand:+ start:169 stop:315 length:147 start_codon:yes stop_codon:yes gene_type:complete